MTEKEEQLYKDRLKKLQTLRDAGIDPYPSSSRRTHQIGKVLGDFKRFEKEKKILTVSGRVRALRVHGKIAFGNLEDESGRLQFLLKSDELPAEKFDLAIDALDIGDFLEITGKLTVTKRGEKSIDASDFTFLAKSLRALPEQWHGLVDTETRLRKRYLDMLANPEVRELFRKKASFWSALREYLEKRSFLEVDTPALEEVPGGADATPFVTHHNALDRDFYLRISLELPLKKIIVGGFEKIYEIGKVFRNEGISTEHLQDYLECEFYWAYADRDELMEMVEDLYKHLAKETTGALVTKWQGEELNWGGKWPRIDYYEAIEKYAGIKPQDIDSDEKLKVLAEKLKLDIDPAWGGGRIIDHIFKKKVRSKLVQPCFLVNHPLEVSPLAKKNPELPGRVDRVQVLAAGTELGNGWSELNDPLDQRKRFEEQMKLREAGDSEAQMLDESFIEALEYGMPPTAGFGLSERLFAIFIDKSVRETVIFPPMKQEKN